MRERNRLLVCLSTLVVSAVGLTACTPSPEDRAAETLGDLTDGLEEVDLTGVRFAGDGDQADADVVSETYAATVAGMGVTPELSVDDLVVDGNSANARLLWSWTVRDNEWTYDTQVDLQRDDDDWEVVWDPTLVEESLAATDTLSATVLAADRGDILAGDGQPIVTERNVIRYGIDKSLIEDAATAESSARALATALDIDVESYVAEVAAAGDKAWVEALVVREDEADLDLLAGTPGVGALPDTLPLAPTRTFAAPVLGSVGAATAELVEDSDGAIAEGDEVGRSGLQRRYDTQLRGLPGLLVRATDADGEQRELERIDATAGTALTTTLDIGLQEKAESLLADVTPASAVVAIRPSDGAVLAAANGPGNDGQNLATTGQYAPGSTFKVVTALALLRSGLTPDSTVSCPSSITVDGREFTNYSDYPADAIGEITLADALANSCNTAFIGAAASLGSDALADAAAALGLGVDAEVGFPAFFGEVPEVDAEESPTSAAATSIGQGEVLASPLAMSLVAASVQSGARVVPSLVTDGDPDQVEPAPEPASPLSGTEATALQQMMGAVVSSGSATFLGSVADGAKTGTAEYGSDDPPATHAWMIAYAGDLAVAVFVETGESGSATAGPILEAFLS